MSLEKLSDEELMFEYQNANVGAFNILYERHKKKVFSYLYRRLSSVEESEEIFQQVFAKLHNSRSTYSNQYAFTQWLFVIVKSVLLDYWQREKSRTQKIASYQKIQNMIIAVEVAGDAGANSEYVYQVHEHLQSLSSDQKLALELRVFDELDYDEIALRLKASEVGARQLVSRALKKIRDKMKDNIKSPPAKNGEK